MKLKPYIAVCLTLLLASMLAPFTSQARYLNPATGRFWTMDTFEGDAEQPSTLHKYLYCGDDPVNETDPSGEDFMTSISIMFNMASWLGIDIYPEVKAKARAAGYKYCVYVRADDDHAWIAVDNLLTHEKHTYGRWKLGYPQNAPAKARSSGVNTDREITRSYKASRGIRLDSFTPTINAGYNAYNNNCATYAQSEWKRASRESLSKSSLFGSFTWDLPSVLKDSILSKNGGKTEAIVGE